MWKVLSTAVLAALFAWGVVFVVPAYRLVNVAQVVGSGTFVSESGQSVRADYRDDGTVWLSWSDGRSMRLRQGVAASGARYVQGRQEWWEHHGQAVFTQADQIRFTGKVQP